MLADKFWIRRPSLVVAQLKRRKKVKVIMVRRCQSSIRMLDLTIVSLTCVCQPTRPFSAFSQVFAKYTVSSCSRMDSLRSILPSSSEVHLKVVPMSSHSSTSTKMHAWLKALSSTSRWLCVLICNVYSRLVPFSEPRTLTLIVTCVNSLVSIWRWSSRITTLKCST
jgi:hypothetical protein